MNFEFKAKEGEKGREGKGRGEKGREREAFLKKGSFSLSSFFNNIAKGNPSYLDPPSFFRTRKSAKSAPGLAQGHFSQIFVSEKS